MATVQYLRPHSVEELAQLQQKLQGIFLDVPSFVASAVLMQELHKRLTTNLHERPAHHDAPEPLASLIQDLDRLRTTFIKISVKGISRSESLS